MTLARLTNYVDGNVLTGAQLNNEFDNILNNGPALVSVSVPTISMVQGLTGSLISNIGSFQANGYQLRSTSGIATLTASSSFSVNTQTAGPVANGRDQAAAFGSTDVHFYAITTGGTSTAAAGICSSAPPPTGPTLPAGYAAWAYLASAKYSTGSSALTYQGVIRGSQYVYSTISAPAILNTGGATTLTSMAGGGGTVAPSAVVPGGATHMQVGLVLGGGQCSTAGALSITQYICSGSSGPLELISATNVLTGGATFNGIEFRNGGGSLQLPVLTVPAAVYYQNVIALGTSASLSLSMVGYSVPNGDVG